MLLGGAGVDLDDPRARRADRRTEGWPAGLYLAALSLKAGAPSSATAGSFRG